jgi:sulfane dehydrogenase subunit SoxC
MRMDGVSKLRYPSSSADAVTEPIDGVAPGGDFLLAELESALRNREMPLEALSHDITPPGLHYLLAHFDIPTVDRSGWRLRVEGLVDRPLALTLDEIRARPAVRAPVTLECAGNGRGSLVPRPIGQPWLHGGVSTAIWTGTPLWPLLEDAGIQGHAVEVVASGFDRGFAGMSEVAYERGLAIDECRRPDVLLVWAMDGFDLPVHHGAPLRLLVPNWYGMASVKWLERLTVVGAPFEGLFHADDYQVVGVSEQHGPPVTRMLPRALLQPPGLPDVETGARSLWAGRHRLSGRAWSGFGPITAVDVSMDSGASWTEADLEEPVATSAWRAWHVDWLAPAGDHVLSARATDATGRRQPLEQAWNLWGYANNAVQLVAVTVRPAP